MSGTRRPWVAVIVGLLVSGAALWLVVESIDVADVGDVLGASNPLPALAIVGIVALQLLVRARRWSALLPVAAGGRRIPTRRLAGPLLVGYLGNAVLPARLGEPIRALIVARREPVGTTEALGSVIVERIVDATTLAAVAFGAALVAGGPTWIVQALGAGAAAGIVLLVILVVVGLGPLVRAGDRLGLGRWPRVRDVTARLVATLGGPSRRGPLLVAAGMSTLAWLLDGTSFWLAGQAVGAELPYAAAMVVAGVSVLGTALPSAPGYVGTFELAAAGTASAFGVPGAEALALALTAHVMTLVPLAASGAAALAWMGISLGGAARAAEDAHGA